MTSASSKIRDLATAGLGKNAGMVVGILQGGEPWIAGYGSLDAAIFEIGSVTKVFTTLLLANMVVRGEVTLDDPVQKYLPADVRMPKWRNQEITLFHLATHTSSLPRLPANLWKTVKDFVNPYANYHVSDLYAFLSGYKLKRPIGSRVGYSNLGMGLLGHILGLVAGKSYEDLVRERILQALEMNDTSITQSPEQKERLAPGHNLFGKATANWDIPTLAGAGALRTTAGDLLRFLGANMKAVAQKGSSGPLVESMQLCQRLSPKTRRAQASWYDYALALLFSGLGAFAQWLFALTPGNPHLILAVCWPILFATAWLGAGPGLLATATTMAGTYFLQSGSNFRFWPFAGALVIGLVGGFALRNPRLRNHSVMLGWQHQRLHELGIGIDGRNVWASLARRLFNPFRRGPRFIWHNGGTGGYRSFVGFIPEQDVAVVVLANSAKSVDSVGVNILKLLERKTSRSAGIAHVPEVSAARFEVE
jgi:CubicO group peptidase (beta-lactamase class C family)